MTTIAKYKRRTFKDVAADAHAKGYSEGLAQGRKDRDDLFNTNADLGFTVLTLEKKLANVSLRKLAWSRITNIFKQGN
jgi:hypothetical protein